MAGAAGGIAAGALVAVALRAARARSDGQTAKAKHRFVREQFIPLDVDTVFAFFSDAHNLETITPPWMRFRVRTPKPITIQAGTLIDYTLRVRGVPMRWRSEITVWNPPHRFVDVQVSGPYRTWVHTHTFEPVEGGTLVRDEVEYETPGGSLIDRLIVRPDIEKIFAYRQERLEAWAADRGNTAIRR
jgi:ligand-binding SRPBCC domain-containing protein